MIFQRLKCRRWFHVPRHKSCPWHGSSTMFVIEVSSPRKLYFDWWVALCLRPSRVLTLGVHSFAQLSNYNPSCNPSSPQSLSCTSPTTSPQYSWLLADLKAVNRAKTPCEALLSSNARPPHICNVSPCFTTAQSWRRHRNCTARCPVLLHCCSYDAFRGYLGPGVCVTGGWS